MSSPHRRLRPHHHDSQGSPTVWCSDLAIRAVSQRVRHPPGLTAHAYLVVCMFVSAVSKHSYVPRVMMVWLRRSTWAGGKGNKEAAQAPQTTLPWADVLYMVTSSAGTGTISIWPTVWHVIIGKFLPADFSRAHTVELVARVIFIQCASSISIEKKTRSSDSLEIIRKNQ